MPRTLFAVSDLHVSYAENRRIADTLEPESDQDWLIVAGDVGEAVADIERIFRTLRRRFSAVIWAPGNHKLWTHPSDPVRLRGTASYQELLRRCRDLGVLTPEDDYPVWRGGAEPIVVVPLFQLYDYSFRVPGVTTKEQSLEGAYAAGVVCTDEMLLHPEPA